MNNTTKRIAGGTGVAGATAAIAGLGIVYQQALEARTAIEMELEELKAHSEELQEQLEASEDNVEYYKQALQKLQASTASMEEKYNQCMAQFNEFMQASKHDNKNKGRTIAALRQGLVVLENKIEHLMRYLTVFRERCPELLELLKELLEKVELANASAEEKDEQLAEAMEQVKELMEAVKQGKEQLAEVIRDKNNFEAALEEIAAFDEAQEQIARQNWTETKLGPFDGYNHVEFSKPTGSCDPNEILCNLQPSLIDMDFGDSTYWWQPQSTQGARYVEEHSRRRSEDKCLNTVLSREGVSDDTFVNLTCAGRFKGLEGDNG